MKILNVAQGSAEWAAARALHHCASEAPVMMGASKHTKRTELIRLKQTGAEQEFSDWERKNLLDKGHEVEARARLIIEAEIGEELFPITATDDAGYLLASSDGVNMAGNRGFEHKLWNEELAANLRAGLIGPEHYWQLEQQIVVLGLDEIIFVCSDGTPERMERLVYRPVPGRAKELLAGWKQFDEDVRTYQHVEVLPAPTGRTIKALPALAIQVKGEVVTSNLSIYKAAALDFIGAINTDLKTDQDFADAANNIKACDEAEKKLDIVKAQTIAQMTTVDEVVRTLDEIRESLRSKRLTLNKTVETRKDTIRAEIRQEGVSKLEQHERTINARWEKPYLPATPVDFATAMKGLKTIDSLRDAMETALAQAKIRANEAADKIDVNLKSLRDQAAEHGFLFADLAHIVLKAPEDFAILVKSRIADHKERVRQEEAAKAATQPTPTPVPTAVSQPAAVAAIPAGKRPSDEEIVQVLASHYQVPTAKVIEWLSGMSFKPAKSKAKKAA